MSWSILIGSKIIAMQRFFFVIRKRGPIHANNNWSGIYFFDNAPSKKQIKNKK